MRFGLVVDVTVFLQKEAGDHIMRSCGGRRPRLQHNWRQGISESGGDPVGNDRTTHRDHDCPSISIATHIAGSGAGDGNDATTGVNDNWLHHADRALRESDHLTFYTVRWPVPILPPMRRTLKTWGGRCRQHGQTHPHHCRLSLWQDVDHVSSHGVLHSIPETEGKRSDTPVHRLPRWISTRTLSANRRIGLGVELGSFAKVFDQPPVTALSMACPQEWSGSLVRGYCSEE